jgi:hypothetical protein
MATIVPHGIKHLISPFSSHIVKIFTTYNSPGYNVHYFESMKKPKLVSSSINRHIYPTHVSSVYKLVIFNNTNIEKTDIVCIENE